MLGTQNKDHFPTALNTSLTSLHRNLYSKLTNKPRHDDIDSLYETIIDIKIDIQVSPYV